MASTTGDGPFDDGLDALTVESLRKKLEERNKSIKGTKAVLLNRLRGIEKKDDKGKGKGKKLNPLDEDGEVSGDDNDDKNNNEDKDEDGHGHSGSDKEKKKVSTKKSVGRKTGERSDPVSRTCTDFDERQICKLLKKMGLSTKGKKKELRERLRVALEDDTDSEGETSEEEDEEEEEDDEEEEEEEEEVRRLKRRKTKMKREKKSVKPTVRLDEIEGTLEKFSGEKDENLDEWLDEFEEAADEFEWSEMYKKIYANKLLTGAAAMYMKSKRRNSWKEWKKALIKEFGVALNLSKIYDQLTTLEKRDDETFLGYIYRAVSLAKQVKLDRGTTIKYIVKGVKDDESRKVVLYGAKTIEELREKMLTYEEILINCQKGKTSEKKKRSMSTNTSDKDVKTSGCYTCGEQGHISPNCSNKEKGKKCFKCNEHGHISSECDQETKEENEKKSSSATVRVDVVDSEEKKKYKEVIIRGHPVKAVFDSGSDLHVASASFFCRVGAPPLEKKIISFDGMGSTSMQTLGRFSADVVIDGLTVPLKIDIVPDTWTGHDLIIGGKLSNHAEVRIKDGRWKVVSETEAVEVGCQTDDVEGEKKTKEDEEVKSDEKISSERFLVNQKMSKARVNQMTEKSDPEENEREANGQKWCRPPVVRGQVKDCKCDKFVKKKKLLRSERGDDERLVQVDIKKGGEPISKGEPGEGREIGEKFVSSSKKKKSLRAKMEGMLSEMEVPVPYPNQERGARKDDQWPGDELWWSTTVSSTSKGIEDDDDDAAKDEREDGQDGQ